MDMVLKYKNCEIRTATKGGETVFAIIDICSILGISDHNQAAERLENDEKGSVKIPTPGGVQTAICVNESGLYNLIFRSEKPEAKEFRRWVTHDVLPSIRKTGVYVDPSFTMSSFDIARLSARTHGQTLKMMVDVLPQYRHDILTGRVKELRLSALHAYLALNHCARGGIMWCLPLCPPQVQGIAHAFGTTYEI